jgi:hypothetical protein
MGKADRTLRPFHREAADEIAALHTLRGAGQALHRGVIFSMGAETIPFGPRFFAWPIPCLWSAFA